MGTLQNLTDPQLEDWKIEPQTSSKQQGQLENLVGYQLLEDQNIRKDNYHRVCLVSVHMAASVWLDLLALYIQLSRQLSTTHSFLLKKLSGTAIFGQSMVVSPTSMVVRLLSPGKCTVTLLQLFCRTILAQCQ